MSESAAVGLPAVWTLKEPGAPVVKVVAVAVAKLGGVPGLVTLIVSACGFSPARLLASSSTL